LQYPAAKRVKPTLTDFDKEFLEARKDWISERQWRNYESVSLRFGEFLKGPIFFYDIGTEQIAAFLKSLECGKKSSNTYRDDLNGILTWFAGKPRCWVEQGSALRTVLRFRKRDPRPGIPERISIDCWRELMAYLEAKQPHWVPFFATALFLGIRPEKEMERIADAIQRDWLPKHLRGNIWRLTPELTKDGQERRIPLPANLAKWYAAYPPRAESMRPRSRDEYAEISSGL